MYYLQFLDFEICKGCNLTKEHPKCPAGSSERYLHLDCRQPMTDVQIIGAAVAAYKSHGFRGCVGWHYYNEPLVAADRMWRLMDEIKRQVPYAQFVLWTNGELIPQDVSRFAAFSQIWITNYHRRDFSRVRTVCSNVRELKGNLDDRLQMQAVDSNRPCVRPFAEMIFDYYGNVHICCMDWKGLASPGNIHTSSLGTLVQRVQTIRQAVSGPRMRPDAPAVCRACQLRFGDFTEDFDKPLAREQRMGRDYYANESLPARDTAVAFTSYKVPTRRLDEHFQWNDGVYRKLGLSVYVVTDQEYAVPDYAKCVIFEEDMPVFNLARTSNFGVKSAIEAGHEVVVKSDVDICFHEHALRRFMQCQANEAFVPLYLMAANFPERRWNYVEAPGAEGTVVMTAEWWRQIRYDERCIGYGAEDGILINTIKQHGLILNREAVVWHIAHVPDTPQKENKGRSDHWGRAEGFNPNNLQRNMQFNPRRRKKTKRVRRRGVPRDGRAKAAKRRRRRL